MTSTGSCDGRGESPRPHDAPTGSIVGQRVSRLDGKRLVSGRGRFVADVFSLGQVEAAFLRSPHAHAEIVSIDVSRARQLFGVLDVITAADIAQLGPLPVIYQLAGVRIDPAFALATDRVRYVGEPVAALVAVSRYVVEDALELIEVEYSPLPVVASARDAIHSTGVQLYSGRDNVVGTVITEKGDVESAFQRADVVIKEQFEFGRVAGCALETRGCVAYWDPASLDLDIWISSQAPNLVRDLLSEVLDLPGNKIRVRVPDVGGGFGNKFDFYPEEVVVSVLSRRVGRPVRWVEDRLESFVATSHARQQSLEFELAGDADGRILGIRGRVIGDMGAHLSTVGIGPIRHTSVHVCGPYDIDSVRVEAVAALTNKTPYGSYRGWGQPQANFVHERLIDRYARAIGLSGEHVRRMNLVPVEAFPYDNGMGGSWPIQYDSGDYVKCLDTCLEYVRVHWKDRPPTRPGRTVGIGIACHVESTLLGPSRAVNRLGLNHSTFDEEVVRVDSSGHVTILTGQSLLGQGLETALAQVCSETLGVPLHYITVVSGDTAACPYTGYGTASSRGAAVAGSAVAMAAQDVRQQILQIAAEMMEGDPSELTIANAVITSPITSGQTRSVTFEEVASAAYRRPILGVPLEQSPTLEGRAVFEPSNRAWSYGCTAARVEVDRETGMVYVRDYLMVHDCGTVINPAIVEGQLMGAATQALGNSLFEELVYDEEGQLQTATFADYLVPTASDVPCFTVLHMNTPAPHIPLGMKGMGEAGTIAGPAAIAGAIDDALKDLGVFVRTVPVTPPRLSNQIEEATRRMSADSR